jgi:hypothetical protein
VHLVGLESTALQKRLAHAAAYWVVGRKRCVFLFVFFDKHKNKQPTKQEQEQDKTNGKTNLNMRHRS